MKLRKIRAAALGALSLVCVGAPAAHAAVTVLGNNIAHNCFEVAEFGGNAREGIETCTFALENTPLAPNDRAGTYVNRGILKSRINDLDGALEDYNRAIAIDANLGEAYVDRGVVMIIDKRYDDALQDINRGIDLGVSKLQIAYYNRAVVDEAKGDVRAAYFDYKKAVEIDPTFTLAAENLSHFKVVYKHSDGTN